MPTIQDLYKPSLALLTDLYELTMAYGYWKAGMADWKAGMAERAAVFHLTYRHNPFNGGYALACGLDSAASYIESFRFDGDDLAYLRTLRGNDEKSLFEDGFLDYLGAMRFACDIDGIPEGTVVFSHEPLLRVKGPLIQAQILESALLNLINFQTLIATKAARMTLAAKGEPVIEFGLRRAQGVDGALSASRAAYIGGCAATSNVLAGRLYGVPVKGTHAHSWVMCFDDELEAFKAYAEAMPNNCVFLVDTYDTLEGVRNAIEAGKWLRENGHEMVGIRLDSGDLAYLSIEARRMLDAAGFQKAVIVASNDLDEGIIASLKEQGAKIGVWGVGTKLATAYDQPALGGVYKLSAIRGVDGRWQYKVKLSEQAIKVSTPGVLQVRRFRLGNECIADVICDEESPVRGDCVMIDPLDPTRRRIIPAATDFENLLVPVFRGGKRVWKAPALDDVRRRAQAQLATFHSGIKRFLNPHQYPVGLEAGLHELKTELILKARGVTA